MAEPRNSKNEIIQKAIVSFYAYSAYLTICQLDCTSAHYAVVFNIPVNNISIYFDKLYSIRCLLTGVGCLAEYLLYASIKSTAEPKKVRICISTGNFLILAISRLTFLALLYISSQLAYHIYVILSIESFFGGSILSIMSITPEYSVVITFASNICRLTTPLIQFILDSIWKKVPLITLKIQAFINVIFSAIALVFFIYYGFFLRSEDSGDTIETHSDQDKKSFFETFREAFSPLMMYPAGSLFKDFLYPGTLPYALLERDKCHMINMMSSIVYPTGSLTLFTMELMGLSDWGTYYEAFWLLTIPIAVMTAFVFLAIHTRIPSATRIINSQSIIMLMTTSLVVYHSFLYQLSYIGVAKVVQPIAGGKGGHDGVITFNMISIFVYIFLFSKLSVGYNTTRVDLGYHLPRFRPNHKMSKSNTFWYIFKNMFKRAWKDTGNDFKRNIKNYL